MSDRTKDMAHFLRAAKRLWSRMDRDRQLSGLNGHNGHPVKYAMGEESREPKTPEAETPKKIAAPTPKEPPISHPMKTPLMRDLADAPQPKAKAAHPHVEAAHAISTSMGHDAPAHLEAIIGNPETKPGVKRAAAKVLETLGKPAKGQEPQKTKATPKVAKPQTIAPTQPTPAVPNVARLPETQTQQAQQAVTPNVGGEIAPISEGAAKTETPEFKAWFGESKVRDEQGKPRVVYHGTASDFNEFDPGHAAKFDSGYLGTGNYFTTNPQVAAYYANGRSPHGRDIVRWADDGTRAEVVDRSSGQSLGLFDTFKEADDFVAKRNVLRPQSIPAYLAIKNPFEWGAKTQGVRGLVMRNDRLPEAIHDEVVRRAGFKFNPNSESRETYLNEQALSDAVRDVLTEKGYDGIVAQTKGSQFTGPDGMEIVAFHPQQIKSAIANKGTFDPNNPRIDLNREKSKTQLAPIAPIAPQAPLRTPAEAELTRAIGTRAKQAVLASGLPPQYHAPFTENLVRVLDQMPESALQAIHTGVGAFSFHASPQALAQSLMQLGGPVADRVEAIQQRGEIIGGVVHAGADGRQTVYLDGGKELHGTAPGEHALNRHGSEYYAHELGHVLGATKTPQNERRDSTEAWEEIYSWEIGHSNALSSYATTSPREAFAEFARVLFSGLYDRAKLKGEFPRAFAYFVENGWVDDIEATRGGVKSADVFSHKVVVNRQGDHADIAKMVEPPTMTGAVQPQGEA